MIKFSRFATYLLILAINIGNSEFAYSQAMIKFSFDNAELQEMIKSYAKASGQQFLIEPNVRGRATVISHKEITLEEAYDLMSTALASNGYAIEERENTFVVKAARNVTRGYIKTYNTLPPLKPERIASYLYTFKTQNASDFLGSIRSLSSKDGEFSLVGENKILITDWVSSIHRINEVLVAYDKKDTLPRKQKAPLEKKEKANWGSEPSQIKE